MEGYAEYAVQKKLKIKDRLSVFASVLLILLGFSIWAVKAGWIGPSLMIVGIALTILTVTRQDVEYEYIFVNNDCEISKIIKKSSRKKVYEFDGGKVQKVMPYTSNRFDNERQAHPDMQICDYTSGYPETQSGWYVFILNVKNHTEAVVLELNEKCVEHVKCFYKDSFMQ